MYQKLDNYRPKTLVSTLKALEPNTAPYHVHGIMAPDTIFSEKKTLCSFSGT